MLRALIFDVDGTLADTESVHLAAFNQAFAEFGLDWRWDETLYTKLLDVSGGKERILHYWRTMQSPPPGADPGVIEDTVNRLHELKTAAYGAAASSGALGMRPGVLRLMEEALARDLRLAIATTTSPANIAALLRRAMGTDWRHNFAAIGDAASAPLKKPHPQVYLQVLASLRLAPAACLAFEDSSNGLQAARAAGLATIVTPTRFTEGHDFGAALRVAGDLAAVDVARLRRWHRESVRTGTAARAGPAFSAMRAPAQGTDSAVTTRNRHAA